MFLLKKTLENIPAAEIILIAKSWHSCQTDYTIAMITPIPQKHTLCKYKSSWLIWWHKKKKILEKLLLYILGQNRLDVVDEH